ncbi:MAG: hypothetical protein E7Z69_06470 [Thermoplasmata archaeon]|nr:hypothetical protein [Thermoplasmata archaeon]
MSDHGSTGLRASDGQPRKAPRFGGQKKESDRKRNDSQADSIARQAVRVFNSPDANGVSGEDLEIIVSFLLDRGKLGELSEVMSHLTSESHREVLAGCCFRELSYDLRQGKVKEAGDMASSELVRSALATDPDLLSQELGSYVSECGDYDSLKERLASLESMFPVSEAPFGACIVSGSMDTFARVMTDDIAEAERPEQLRSAIRRYTAPQDQDVPATLLSEEFRKKVNEIALEKVSDIAKSKLDGATDVSELSRVNEAFDMSDVLEITPEFRNWMRNEVRGTARRIASDAVASAPDYRGLVAVFDDLRMNDQTEIINDPEFKRIFVDRAEGFLSAYTDVRQLRDERRNGFTAPIDEELSFAVRSITIDLMTRSMSECDDIQSLNSAMGAIRNEGLMMELSRLYSKRAEGIIRSSSTVAEATSGYEGLVDRYLDLSSSSAELCQAYCDTVVSLVAKLGEWEVGAASRDASAASTLASTLVPRIPDMPPATRSAWLWFFESEGTPKTNETRSAVAELKRAASERAVGCADTAYDGRVHTFF